MPDLLVTQPFGEYAAGDRIRSAEAEEVLASVNVHHTVPVARSTEPEPHPAKATRRRAPKEG